LILSAQALDLDQIGEHRFTIDYGLGLR
jgi:hypothetical protein